MVEVPVRWNSHRNFRTSTLSAVAFCWTPHAGPAFDRFASFERATLDWLCPNMWLAPCCKHRSNHETLVVYRISPHSLLCNLYVPFFGVTGELAKGLAPLPGEGVKLIEGRSGHGWKSEAGSLEGCFVLLVYTFSGLSRYSKAGEQANPGIDLAKLVRGYQCNSV